MVNPRKSAGISLVELMVVTAAISVLAIGLTSMMLNIMKFNRLNAVRINLQRDARGIMEIVTRSLRQAQSSTIVIDTVAGQPPYSRITFTKAQGNVVRYFQQGPRFIMQDGAVTRVLANNLRYLSFALPRTDDLTIVSVELTLEEAVDIMQKKALHMASEKVRIMN